MTDPRVRELLAEPLPPDPELPPLNEYEEHVLRHLCVAGALLPEYAERYRALLRERQADGASEELRERALSAAADLAAVLQSAWRQAAATVVVDERTDFEPLTVLGALDHVFHGLTILTEPEGDASNFVAVLSERELDDVLAMPGLEDYLDPAAAIARMRAARGS